MLRYVVRRIGQTIPILIIVSILSFGLMQVGSYDYLDAFSEQTGQMITEQEKQGMREELGLTKPIYQQYGDWLRNAVQGDMGDSYVSGKPVTNTFFEKLPKTIIITVVSMCITLLIAIPVGIYIAIKQNTIVDHLVRFLSFISSAIPSFLLAFLLLYIFAVRWRWVSVINTDHWSSYLLPVLALVIPMTFKFIRQIRVAVLEELQKEYVEALYFRGIAHTKIIFTYILKAISPTIITIIGISLGSLLGGTIIIESIFMIDGVGKMAIDAIVMRDYPIIQAYALWMFCMYTGLHIIIDCLYVAVNPRMRLQGGVQK